MLANGVDPGPCRTGEIFNPNNGDSLQFSLYGMFVWQALTNTLRYTNGYFSVTYSPCGLQSRLNIQSFRWELNPSLIAGGGAAPGACDYS
jgi:hypothetical protein